MEEKQDHLESRQGFLQKMKTILNMILSIFESKEKTQKEKRLKSKDQSLTLKTAPKENTEILKKEGVQMPSFSSRSQARLDTCDQRLQKVFNEVIKHWDCTILEGHRDEETQNEYYRQGKSKLKYPNGKHNSIPSKAVDVAPYPINWQDLDRFRAFGNFVLGVGSALGIPLRWGGDWDGDRSFKDQSFHDLPHFELKE